MNVLIQEDGIINADRKNANANTVKKKVARNKALLHRLAYVGVTIGAALSLVFAILLWPKDSGERVFASIPVDWINDVPDVSFTIEQAGEVSGVKLRLTKVYPWMRNASERYHENIELNFDASGKIKGRDVELKVYVVVQPNVVSGECLILKCESVSNVECKAFDKDGALVVFDTQALCAEMRHRITNLCLRYERSNSIDGVPNGTLWFSTSGVECCVVREK